MYFNNHKTYSGNLINFAYIPKSHNPKSKKNISTIEINIFSNVLLMNTTMLASIIGGVILLLIIISVVLYYTLSKDYTNILCGTHLFKDDFNSFISNTKITTIQNR